MKLKTVVLIFAGVSLVWGQSISHESMKQGAESGKSRHVKKKRAKQSGQKQSATPGASPGAPEATRTHDPITTENPMDPKGPTNPKNPVPPRTPINPETPAGPKDPPRPPAGTPPQP